ncbi:AraC family transcriptional regulator with amidase-like domain [Roseibium hamelinense]|uniref:AraC family transcriptional regulator with amidase-like domain n=1 Tax=Roseibium hamelinense TaxID=150831 RepID=A0A562T7W5_9HYPH|nr:GlxA family transcriptional regulator [Roseibium hamelinense]MTI43564.1 GlxA family transcriptional regulator [Roseibium hamelinense]TWI89642.1 AraC family transcriptional regulator with amidase-like domain [Roseibium hamelinense]
MSEKNKVESDQTIALVMLDRFSMNAFASVIEPLRLANRLIGRDYYRWNTYSLDGNPVEASNGCKVAVDFSLKELNDADITLLCSGIDVERLPLDPELGTKLRRLNAMGRTFGAVCTGAYVLARYNLLDGRRCTIHWENLRSLREEFPNVEVTSDIFAIDRNCITCAGGMASLDMMLRMIAIQHGAYLAHEVAEVSLYQNMRSGESAQRHDIEARTGISNAKILDAIRIMDLHIEDPLSCQQLAMTVNLSPRQLERLFRRHFNCTPGQYYLRLRLETARDLLRRTSRPVLDVALACGFASTSHFTKCYRERFLCTPTEERQSYQWANNNGRNGVGTGSPMRLVVK